MNSTRASIGSDVNDLEVKITTPRCDTVDLPAGSNPGEGVYSGSLEGWEIWVLVYGPDRKYYPQSSGDPCQGLSVPAANGHWRTNLFLGVNPPEQFDIVITITNVGSKASQDFKKWLKDGCDNEKFLGFSVSELPDGLTEMDAITVMTK